MAGDKETPKKEGTDYRMYGLAAVVLVAVLAAVGYYGGFLAPPSAPAANSTITPPLSTPEAKLLLSTFDRGAAFASGDYFLEYAENDNGAKTNYSIARAGNDSWVSVREAASRMSGFFGANESNDIVCLEYGGVEKCAMAGSDESMKGIAKNLRTLLQNSTAYSNGRAATGADIEVGAVRFSPGISEEKTGRFDTEKISYVIDYRNLTIQQLVSVGLSPSDDTLRTVRKVTFWVDKKTGMVAKSSMVELNGIGMYEREFVNITGGSGVALPDRNMTRVGPEAFVAFYTQSQNDYLTKIACLGKAGAEKYSCLKSLAAEQNDWEICRMMDNVTEYESCTLIVAQKMHNRVLCGNLTALADECYIAVASETGNFELCKSLKNQSMGSACNQAAAAGKKLQDEADAEAARKYALRDCGVDSDCRTFGNANQYCAPKNTTRQFANETSQYYACLKDVQCGCQGGYCGFAKNDTYYACMSAAEDKVLEEYIKSLIPGNSSVVTKENFSG